ncbi:uncharacterized protein LOC125646044 isoform X2 [Ostrea edulis]|uniref:uncharacterized protein LOC125646044 isoform X2 n=1 Tax=Ostrea edulis TaxID=37623 RepID=UPI0024AF9FA9|nr:uncharacterized protein LOC125646044 isoform X2 [Ostrea edulis]
MYIIFKFILVIGLVLSSKTEGNKLKTVQNIGLQISGDGTLDIDNGSGVGPTFTDDEDLGDDFSGELSGSGHITTKFHLDLSTVLTTTRSLTACEQLRLSTENTTSDVYRPKCTINGEYESLQCHQRMFNKECWCVDRSGDEITGSKMMQPNVPDCISGKGLKPCVFQLLKKKQGLLGVYHPRCTIDGEFEKIQCHGSACWCVDEVGVERQDTRVYQPEVPNCSEHTKKTTSELITPPSITVDTTMEPGISKQKTEYKDTNKYITRMEENEDSEDSIHVVFPGMNEVSTTKGHDIHKENNENTGNPRKAERQESSAIVYIMGRPGLLAGCSRVWHSEYICPFVSIFWNR